MKDQRALEFSQPTNQTGLMIFVLAAVSFVAYLLFPAVAPIFFASPYLNGFILSVFLLGILACFWQVYILVSSVYWIEGFVSDRPGHDFAKPPRILASLEALLRDKESRRNINALSARSILDSVATRLDEVRDITRYIINLLIFLGLLGTFYGLATTVPAVVETIKSLAPKEGQTGLEAFEGLMTGLESQLGGMGTAFASSLLGLAGSLVVGLLELFAGHGQNRFYMELEEWLSSISKISQSPSNLDQVTGESEGMKAQESINNQKINYLIDVLGNHENQAVNTQIRIAELTKTIESRMSNIREKDQDSPNQIIQASASIQSLIKNQENLVSLIRNYVEIENSSDTEFRARIRNMDVQLARIFDELASGRQENLSELRQDLAMISNSILKLASSKDQAQKE
ncbi:MAG: biopolymer transporter ExbB [Paracoccaceae bacterium]